MARTTCCPSSSLHFRGDHWKYTPQLLGLLKIDSLSASSVTGTAVSEFNFRSVLTLTRYGKISSCQIGVSSTKASEMTLLNFTFYGQKWGCFFQNGWTCCTYIGINRLTGGCGLLVSPVRQRQGPRTMPHFTYPKGQKSQGAKG